MLGHSSSGLVWAHAFKKPRSGGPGPCIQVPRSKTGENTSVEKVLPVLSDIYDTYGNPSIQISDNGAPFNSKAMGDFSHQRGITQQKIPPLHPSANPAETFMRPLGKAMKIAHDNNTTEKQALRELLSNYRNTPHP